MEVAWRALSLYIHFGVAFLTKLDPEKYKRSAIYPPPPKVNEMTLLTLYQPTQQSFIMIWGKQDMLTYYVSSSD